jgi:outer membrane protein OmpA-like peptidoglycan-associated protein
MEIVVPKIPAGGKVIIHGYTDITGDAAYNQTLSLERANDVRNILSNGLSKVGKSGVLFEVYGFGEDEDLSPFDNTFPEERFYNRTVIIDIVPGK